MTDNPHNLQGSAAPTPEGEALYEVMIQIPRLYHLMRSINIRGEDLSSWTDGMWSLLRSLQLDGPRTVPQIARARGLSRQRIQKLVDEAQAAALVRLRTNPDHKKSRIVALTREGATLFEQIDKELRQTAEGISHTFDIRDLDAALRILFDLRESLEPRRR